MMSEIVRPAASRVPLGHITAIENTLLRGIRIAATPTLRREPICWSPRSVVRRSSWERGRGRVGRGRVIGDSN